MFFSTEDNFHLPYEHILIKIIIMLLGYFPKVYTFDLWFVSVLLKPGLFLAFPPQQQTCFLQESLLTDLRGKEEEAQLGQLFVFQDTWGRYLEDHPMTCWLVRLVSKSSK